MHFASSSLHRALPLVPMVAAAAAAAASGRHHRPRCCLARTESPPPPVRDVQASTPKQAPALAGCQAQTHLVRRRRWWHLRVTVAAVPLPLEGLQALRLARSALIPLRLRQPHRRHHQEERRHYHHHQHSFRRLLRLPPFLWTR
ncbi:hypothetical protein DFJ73DRAFT_814018 [Zopfochytrium polystomum]|nr:hypothetical protein DFJ73DRAFT_814018 [Zopfochytrium polystomum]